MQVQKDFSSVRSASRSTSYLKLYVGLLFTQSLYLSLKRGFAKAKKIIEYEMQKIFLYLPPFHAQALLFIMYAKGLKIYIAKKVENIQSHLLYIKMSKIETIGLSVKKIDNIGTEERLIDFFTDRPDQCQICSKQGVRLVSKKPLIGTKRRPIRQAQNRKLSGDSHARVRICFFYIKIHYFFLSYQLKLDFRQKIQKQLKPYLMQGILTKTKRNKK